MKIINYCHKCNISWFSKYCPSCRGEWVMVEDTLWWKLGWRDNHYTEEVPDMENKYRQIKFREWNWYEIKYEPFISLYPSASVNEIFKKWNHFMQYTWIDDKEWIEIYEWDIIWCWMKYDDWNFKYWKIEVKYEWTWFNIPAYSDTFIVLGNIYDTY